MQRRLLITSPLLLALPPAFAHHGWSSFDTERPLFLEGVARKVAWRNPHAEFELELPANFSLPADLGSRAVPAQTAGIDGAKLLKQAQLPTRKDRRWEVELAPISRMESWKVTPIKDGDRVGVLGYTFAGEKGAAILRAEYLFVGTQAYGLRSSPA